MTITTLAELSANLNDGKTSSVEITQDYLTRIENSTHNAFISVNAELAISQAKKADQQRANGEASPLLGVPVAQKDIFCICLLYTSPSPRDLSTSRMPSSA